MFLPSVLSSQSLILTTPPEERDNSLLLQHVCSQPLHPSTPVLCRALGQLSTTYVVLESTRVCRRQDSKAFAFSFGACVAPPLLQDEADRLGTLDWSCLLPSTPSESRHYLWRGMRSGGLLAQGPTLLGNQNTFTLLNFNRA